MRYALVLAVSWPEPARAIGFRFRKARAHGSVPTTGVPRRLGRRSGIAATSDQAGRGLPDTRTTQSQDFSDTLFQGS
jgi:hypothetical protein